MVRTQSQPGAGSRTFELVASGGGFDQPGLLEYLKAQAGIGLEALAQGQPVRGGVAPETVRSRFRRRAPGARTTAPNPFHCCPMITAGLAETAEPSAAGTGQSRAGGAVPAVPGDRHLAQSVADQPEAGVARQSPGRPGGGRGQRRTDRRTDHRIRELSAPCSPASRIRSTH